MNLFNDVMLWAAISLCAFIVCKSCLAAAAQTDAPHDKEMPHRLFLILTAVCAVIALAIRVWKFGSVPGGFNQDGAMAAVDAKALADYGTDRFGMKLPVHLTAWGYGQMSALLSYLMVPFIKIGGLNAITARLPQLLATAAALVCLYLFVKDVFGKKAAIVVSLFAAINPWNILQSRWALDCNLYPQFFIMGVYFLNKGLKRRLHLVISMIMFGLCMYCYGVSIYTLPPFLLAACIYLLVTKRLTVKDALIALGVYLLVAWPFIATMAINFFGIDTIETPLFTIPYFPGSVRSGDILFFSDNIGQQLAANFKSLMNVTLLQRKDLPWNDVDNFGTMYLFSMPFVIVGIFSLIKDYRKSAGAVFALMFLCAGLWCGLTTNGVNVNRINIVYYPIIIMAGMGICYVIKWLPHAKWGIMAAYAAAFIMFMHTYFTSYTDIINANFFKNFGEAVSDIKDTDAEKIYITADSQYEGASTVSEILTMFYHEIDAEYYQGKVKGDIPYSDKYVFQSIKNITVDPAQDAVYVITENDRRYFDETKFDFKQFGNYYTVTPKK